MVVAAAFVSVLLAALLVVTAARKLGHRPAVVATYRRVGVPEERLNQLAVLHSPACTPATLSEATVYSDTRATWRTTPTRSWSC